MRPRYSERRVRRMVREIASKAERSRKIRILMWPESAVMRWSLVILMRAVSVLWRALIPD